MNYLIKVKNNLGKDKKIKLINGDNYTLKDKDEKIIGTYSKDNLSIIFTLLKQGFEVSKILEENIKDYMKIETITTDATTVSNIKNEVVNEINNDNIEKPKKRRGRPPKNKK